MISRSVLVLLLSLFACPVMGQPIRTGATADSGTTAKPQAIDRLLDQINRAGAYRLPDVQQKQDRRYADTSSELVPYRNVQPYQQHFLRQLEYTGPGRAEPEPEDVATVKLGFIGPIEQTVSVATGGRSRDEQHGQRMLQGARLAVEQANARGGYHKRKLPFELVVRNDNGLWGASGNEIVQMAYVDRVWAILGTIDGANTHIAIRVALKAEIPMMNTGDTDPTLMETNIPWIVRCIGDDRRQGYLLVDYLYRKLDRKRVGVIRASNRYGRFGVREIRDSSRRLGRPIALEMAYESDATDFSLHLERLGQAGVDAVVHWGDATAGAEILNQMRALGMQQPFFASDRCASDEFVRHAGQNADGVICTFPWNPQRQDPKLDEFRAAYEKRFGEPPDTFAAHAFDGMNMLIWAVQHAGLNRAKIRDVLAYQPEPWPGVTGEIPLSAVLDDAGEVFLCRFQHGRWQYFSRAELEIPPRERAAEQTR